MQEEPLQIDIRKLFSKKNPRLARLIPGFVYRYISGILHEKEINKVLRTTMHLKDAQFAEFIVNHEVGAKISSTGLENIPKSGGAIIVCNHPLGGLDGMMLMSESYKMRQDVRIIVNDILTEIPNFGEIFIPVNKFGKKAKESLKQIEAAYAEGHLVLVFPAGLCSRKINGVIRDLTWQKSFVSRSLKYNLPVIPVHFSGKNSNRFYNLANFRKFFRIKVNIEMFFLVDELYRQKGKKFSIVFGKPIPAETFDTTHTQAEWAELMKDFVYTLKTNPEASFQDFIAADSASKKR